MSTNNNPWLEIESSTFRNFGIANQKVELFTLENNDFKSKSNMEKDLRDSMLLLFNAQWHFSALIVDKLIW